MSLSVTSSQDRKIGSRAFWDKNQINQTKDGHRQTYGSVGRAGHVSEEEEVHGVWDVETVGNRTGDGLVWDFGQLNHHGPHAPH